jgi:hypothetical protein
MRSYLLFAFVVSLFSLGNTSQAQTLQFSQVLLVTSSQTVPANKVWKVESYTPSAVYAIHSGTPQTHAILVNNLSRIVGMTAGFNGNHSSSSVHDAYSFKSFPMWLPSNTTLAVSTGVAQLSVVEFTVVP